MIDSFLAVLAAALSPGIPVFEELPRGVRALLLVDASCETAYEILADHDAYPEFMPGVLGVRTVRKGPGWADVAFEYRRGGSVLQHRTYDPPESIRWRAEGGDSPQIKSMSGSWRFAREAAPSRGACQVSYELQVEPKLPVPSVVITRFMRPIVERTLDAVGHRIASGGIWKWPGR